MRTSGTGSEALMFIVPIAIVAVFAVYLAGGPLELLRILDSTLTQAAGIASDWLRGWR